MTRWLPSLVMLIAALTSAACALAPAAQTSPPPMSQPPTPSQQATATAKPSAATPAPASPGCGFNGPAVVLAVAVACAGTPPPQPSDVPTAEYTPYPDPPGTFADCRPYAQGALPTPTPRPDTTPGPTFDPGGLVPCGRDEWRQALDPVVRAIGRDKRNFCDAYFPVSEFDPGPWRLVINFVAGADPAARARVEALIQPGAPVEWREVKFSHAELVRLKDGPLLRALGPNAFEKVSMYGIDTVANAVSVTTRGPQPELKAQLEQEFGDEVVVDEGPTELPSPI